MKKIISAASAVIFLANFYLLPSLSAITLGEIKPDREDTGTQNKSTDKAEQEKKKNEQAERREEPVPKKEFNEDNKEINPRLVCLLSVLMPGGGHFYMNNDVKGIGFCLAAGVGYTAAGFFMVKTMLADTGSTAYKNYLLLTGFIFFITLIVHFVGIIEAYSDAEELNKERLFGKDGNNPYLTEIVSK